MKESCIVFIGYSIAASPRNFQIFVTLATIGTSVFIIDLEFKKISLFCHQIDSHGWEGSSVFADF